MTNRRRLTLVSVVVSLAALCSLAAPARAWYQYGTASYSYAYAPTFQAAVSDCDDCITTVALPFAFPYYGKSYSTVTISSNGVMRLGSYSDGASMFYNPQLGYDGNGSYNYPLIAPLWDDWDTLKGGSIYAGRSGTTGPFVVEWYGVQHHAQTTGAGYTFEAKLFPDGGIEFHYMSVDNGQAFDRGANATVGYQEGGTTVGLGHSYNAPSVWSSSALRWNHPGRVGFYAKVQDGVRPTPLPRGSLNLTMSYVCIRGFSFTSGSVGLTTGTHWSASTMNTTSSSCQYGDTMSAGVSFGGATDGYDVVTLPFGSVRSVTSGLYFFQFRQDFTPKPDVAPRWDYVWNVAGGTVNVKSKLDYWTSGPLDKPILIITGFDPLNEDSTASYLALMTGLVRPLMAEGFDVGIGKFAYGNLNLTWFRDETGRWINDAYARSGNHKVQVAGVSMGGIVLRHTLATNYFGSANNVSAWYSVDSPQKGANLGRGNIGVQNLVLCNKASSDPAYKKLFSAPSADMNMRWVTSCSCDDEPENSRCSSTAANHDAYYNSVGWPSSSIPRYAVAFGDGTGTWTAVGSGKMYDFYYGGTCSDDGDWNGGSRDIMAGSKYLDAAQVNSSKDHWWCGNSGVRLVWEPAFINVDSALAGVTTPEYDAEGTSAPNYSVSVTRWNGWYANDWNEYHKVVSAGIINQIMAWARIYQ